MSDKNFYITTTLPYVNSDPHVGFAMEIIRADAIARYKKLMGYEVFFNTGTDEHGLKIHQKAEERGVDVQAYVDEYAQKFRNLKESLGLSEDIHFVRTTDEQHVAAAQEFWKRCDDNGYIYKKDYQVKYCVGCELEKTESDLDKGRCPIHPDRELELIDEENYFFKFSAFQDQLLELYNSRPDFVLPDFRFNEIKAFVERGLDDFSISRVKEKMPWGVPVPGDDGQVIYVWFDALVNYISTLQWPFDGAQGEPGSDFEKYWVNGTPTQIAGKDNLRQQSAMWQAMLMAADLPNSYQILINGFINSGGQKMSKSLGNVIDPNDIVTEYGTEALRYYLLRHVNQFEDSDMTMEKFKEAYNANLANGIGNLVSRLLNLCEKNLDGVPEIPEKTLPQEWLDAMDAYRLDHAADVAWQWIGELDQEIAEKQPFKLVKTDKEAASEMLAAMSVKLYTIGRMLNPLLPETSQKIKELIKENKKPSEPLFIRKD
jgi:methionyl-tRNA synthetase